MKPQGEVKEDNTELIDSLLVYYRKKASDENRDTLKGIVGNFRNEPKNIPHDIDRFCRHLEMNKPLLSSLTAMSSLERILLVPRKGKKK